MSTAATTTPPPTPTPAPTPNPAPAADPVQAFGALLGKRMIAQQLSAANNGLKQIEANLTRAGVITVLGGDAELTAYESALAALIAKATPPAPTK